MIATIQLMNDDPSVAKRALLEQEERIATLKARLREWEEELHRKKHALSEADQKIVDPILKDKLKLDGSEKPLETSADDHSLDNPQDVFVEHEFEYEVPVGKDEDFGDISGQTKDPLQGDIPELDAQLAWKELGTGPMRFVRNQDERSLREQIESLSAPNRQCYEKLVNRWHQRARRGGSGGFALPNEWILRFARNNISYSKTDAGHNLIFQEKKAWKAMRKFKRRYLNLTAYQLEEQLLTKTLFPVPGLKTADGHDMFYMKPSRYFPKETSTRTIINNLAYVMMAMLESKEANCRNGIGFVANMDDWSMRNFDVNYCFQYMMCLQGFMVPVKVELFLIVNPPSWFGTIWKIMRPMLAPSFRKKVKVILADKLPKYLQSGFEQYLPAEMEYGEANTDQMVHDFINFRKYYERKTGLCNEEQANDCSMSGSISSGLSLTSFDTAESCSPTRIPGVIPLFSLPGESRNDDLRRVVSTEDFTPKIAMKKSRDSFMSKYDEAEWSDLHFDLSEPFSAPPSSEIAQYKGEANQDDNDDASIFDDDLSLFGDIGW